MKKIGVIFLICMVIVATLGVFISAKKDKSDKDGGDELVIQDIIETLSEIMNQSQDDIEVTSLNLINYQMKLICLRKKELI